MFLTFIFEKMSAKKIWFVLIEISQLKIDELGAESFLNVYLWWIKNFFQRNMLSSYCFNVLLGEIKVALKYGMDE